MMVKMLEILLFLGKPVENAGKNDGHNDGMPSFHHFDGQNYEMMAFHQNAGKNEMMHHFIIFMKMLVKMMK